MKKVVFIILLLTDIGYIGSTGISVGPHLHYMIYHNSNPDDSYLWFYHLETIDPIEFI